MKVISCLRLIQSWALVRVFGRTKEMEALQM